MQPREHKQSVTFADLEELKTSAASGGSHRSTSPTGSTSGRSRSTKFTSRFHSSPSGHETVTEGSSTSPPRAPIYRRARSTSSPASQFALVQSSVLDTDVEDATATRLIQEKSSSRSTKPSPSPPPPPLPPPPPPPPPSGMPEVTPHGDPPIYPLHVTPAPPHHHVSITSTQLMSPTPPPCLHWELLLEVLTYLLIILTFPLSLFICLRVIAQYERAVIFRLGRLLPGGAKGPGLMFLMPCIDSSRVVDMRTFTFDVPTQEVLTKDSVTVVVAAVVYYRIFDPIMSVVNVEDANRSTRLLAQTTLRNVLGTVDLYHLLVAREQIAHQMQACLDSATDVWGVKVERTEIKDVRLPTMLQRAMAAEAEAAREARAKVIAAEGEERASEALRRAALQLSDCPIAMQLRYLQTLNTISSEKNSTIIFPFPMDLVNLVHRWAPQLGDEEMQETKHSKSAPPLDEQII